MVVPTLRLWRLGCGLGTFHTQNPRVISYKTVTSELFVGKKRGERERERERERENSLVENVKFLRQALTCGQWFIFHLYNLS